MQQAIVRAVENGINYFDTAPLYGSEEMFGQALKPYRDRVFIATKVRESTASETLASIQDSLTRLQTDYVDLVQYHGEWLTKEVIANLLKPDGVLTGMQKARDAGMVRYIGFTSEGSNGGVSQLINTGEFDMLQIQYNLMFQHPYDPEKQAGVMLEAESQGMGIVVMRPFTGGLFPRWLKHVYPNIEQRIEARRLMEGLLHFVLSNPLTDVAIVGMRSAERVDQNCNISDNLTQRIDLEELYGRFLDR